MDVLIRYAQPEDVETMVGIFNPIIKASLYTAFDTPFTMGAEKDYIRNLSPRSIVHVAECR